MIAMALSRTQIPPCLKRGATSLGRALWSGVKKSCVWFVPMFLTAAATAWLSYEYNQMSNTKLALQQQTFSDLQAFRNSGADLDQALGALSDAIVEGREVAQAKSNMRSAISRQISDALANEQVLGGASKGYIADLARLRLSVDEVDQGSVETSAVVWEQALALMSQRRKLIAAAQLRVAER